jgi:hypothetical protein
MGRDECQNEKHLGVSDALLRCGVRCGRDAVLDDESEQHTRLSRQHVIDFDSGLKPHRATVLHKRSETPLANRIECGRCQQRVPANHAKLLHRAILSYRGFQDDRALKVLLPCRLRIFRFNPSDQSHGCWSQRTLCRMRKLSPDFGLAEETPSSDFSLKITLPRS